MIMQVFDHSSCRLASKYLLKNFIAQEDTAEPSAGEQEMDSKDLRKQQIIEHMRDHGDRSSVFYTDEDFKDLLKEWDSEDKPEHLLNFQERTHKNLRNAQPLQTETLDA